MNIASVLTANRSRGSELDPTVRAAILAAVDSGLSKAEIARRYNISRRTVYNTINRLSTANSLNSRPRTGRPPKLSIRDRRRLIRMVRLQPKIVYALLRQESSISTSKSTFYRVIKACGITN